MTMKLLYLVANQEMLESRASFVAAVTRRMGAELLILVAAEDQQVLDNAESSFSLARTSKTARSSSTATW